MTTITATVNPALSKDELDASQAAADAVTDNKISAIGLSEDHPHTPTVTVSNYGLSAVVSWKLSTDTDADPTISIHIHISDEGVVITPRLWVVSEEYGVPVTTVHTEMDSGNMGNEALIKAVEAVATLFPGSPMANLLIERGESA